MRTIWMIGGNSECDIVVSAPTVSGRHCELAFSIGEFTVTDLGSSNGTFVNGSRISELTVVKPADVITLGKTFAFPWSEVECRPGTVEYTIGRVAGNDIVIDDSRVSGRHARLLVRDSSYWLEDLGSSNGVFVNSIENRGADRCRCRTRTRSISARSR